MAKTIVPYEGPIVTRAEAKAAGLKRFFTGESCKYGHIAERLIGNRECLDCSRERQRSSEHRTGARAREARYRQSAEWRKSARERVSRYSLTPKSKIVLQRYALSPKGKARTERFNRSPKGKASRRIRDAAKRARKLAAGGTFTSEDLRKLRAYQKKCHICGKRFTKADPATIDHVIALADGGAHDASNIALAHLSCNQRKHANRTHLI